MPVVQTPPGRGQIADCQVPQHGAGACVAGNVRLLQVTGGGRGRAGRDSGSGRGAAGVIRQRPGTGKYEQREQQDEKRRLRSTVRHFT